MHITLHTNKGNIILEMMEQDAPKTVGNFVKLAKNGFYDGTKFHRVIAGFMIQGGDPNSKDDERKDEWGMGGPGYQFADEIHEHNENDMGTIAMANAGPGTNGSQFFINTTDNHFLDSKHTVFGRVALGFDVIKSIERTSTDPSDRPFDPVIIEKVDVVQADSL
ncbi:MAG TPA: peptidylprolyl isomerase [Candidatus Paceibacterota bacterium]